MVQRVRCYTASCDICKKAILVKETWSDKYYTCTSFQKKHKAIDAQNCGEFRCNSYKEGKILCKNCTKGE